MFIFKPPLQAALWPDHFYVPVVLPLILWSKSETLKTGTLLRSALPETNPNLPFGKPIRDGGLGVQGKGEV